MSTLITEKSEKFPLQLRNLGISRLYVRGNVDLLTSQQSNKFFAVVGTRTPTEFGIKKAKEITKQLVDKHQAVIVSGLALGCDTVAHEMCLESGGKTVAVLAQGLDQKIYPSSNAELAKRILASGGCLISEHPDGVAPKPSFFVLRNRIQTALSSSVVVIETGRTGGTMHTVKFALNQKRKLYCCEIPSSLENDQNCGNKNVFKMGALNIETIFDETQNKEIFALKKKNKMKRTIEDYATKNKNEKKSKTVMPESCEASVCK